MARHQGFLYPCTISHFATIFFFQNVQVAPTLPDMNVLRFSSYLCSLLILVLTAQAGGKKSPPASITFHLEGSVAEAPQFARAFNTLAGERYFRKVPEISSKNIQSFSPFPADDERSYGLVFKLDEQGTRRLNEVTTMNQSKLLLSLVNGQPIGVVRIDKPVTDGILVVWSGITEQEIKLYDHIAPRIGEDTKAWKARLKKLKKESKNN